MGIKWREGELQIKGRVSSLGTQVFCGRHHGVIERWVKWSYAHLPAPYQRLFLAGQEAGLVTAAVRKTRALRKVRLDTLTGQAHEVDVQAFVDRGLSVELSDWKSLGRPIAPWRLRRSQMTPPWMRRLPRLSRRFLTG